MNGNWRSPGPTGAEAPPETIRQRFLDQLATEIGEFLADDEDVKKIDFHLGISERRIFISGEKLKKIGIELQRHQLKLQVSDAAVRKGAGAHFARNEDQFVFRGWIAFSEAEMEDMPDAMRIAIEGTVFRDDALSLGLVVHEAVHAILSREGRSIVRLSDEAAAYLTQGLFHRFRGTDDLLLKSKSDSESRRIFETANELIDEHRLHTNPGQHLSWLQYKKLRKAIHDHELYKHLGPIERYD